MPDETMNPLLALPMSDDEIGQWQERISQAEGIRKTVEPEWAQNIHAYEGKPLAGTVPADFVNVNKDYSTVRQKAAQLFFRTGEIQASPKQPLMAGQEATVELIEALINDQLGAQGINAKRMVRRVLFHVLTCSVAPTKINYEAYTRQVEVPVMDPALVPPELQSQIPTQPVSQVIAQRFCWESFSPKRLLLPAEFEGDDYDQAAWIGFKYALDVPVAIRRFGLSEEFEGTAASEEDRLSKDEKGSATTDRRAHCTEIWYYAARMDPTEVHPDVQRVVTFVEGVDGPVEHRPSPHQTVQADGALTADSLIGFPIHPLCLNYVTDRAYPPSDATMIRPLVNELSKFRSQMIRQRDTSIPMRGYDPDRVQDPAVLAKLEEGVWQGMLPIPGGAAQGAIWEIARAQYPRENFTAQEYTEKDLEQTLALGRNQGGTESDTQRTATELQIIQGNADVRLDDERNAVIDWYVRGVQKLWTLMQRYADESGWARVLGQQGAAQLVPWQKAQIQGRYAFTVKPDSTVRPDAGSDKKQALDLYNFLAKDPQINRTELLRQICGKFNLDAAKLLVTQAPEKKPEPANVSWRFAAVDLDPTLPQFPLVLSMLQQSGYQIDPGIAQQMQQHAVMQSQILNAAGVPSAGPNVPKGPLPKPSPDLTHGGLADKSELLNKHQEERTGAMQGTGQRPGAM